MWYILPYLQRRTLQQFEEHGIQLFLGISYFQNNPTNMAFVNEKMGTKKLGMT